MDVEILAAVDDVIREMQPAGDASFSKLNCLVYAGAGTVERRVKKPVTLAWA